MNKVLTGVNLLLLVLATSAAALCAEIVGTVSDTRSQAVGGIQISAIASTVKTVKQTVTDESGKYWLIGLEPGKYQFILKPLQTGYKGGNAVSFVGIDGLTLNWRLSARRDAIALASEGASDLSFAGDPFGLTADEFAGLVLAGGSLGSAVIVGGISAAGGLSGSSPSGPPVSPSK